MNVEVLLRDQGITPFRARNKDGGECQSACFCYGGAKKRDARKCAPKSFHTWKEQNNCKAFKKGLILNTWIPAGLPPEITLPLLEGYRASKSFSLAGEKAAENNPVVRRSYRSQDCCLKAFTVLKRKARHFKKSTFKQLVENVKKCLLIVPRCYPLIGLKQQPENKQLQEAIAKATRENL